MTLREKLCEPFDGLLIETIDKLEKIVEDEIIAFSLWKERNASQDIDGMYYGESRLGISRNKPINIKQLLEIYKKEKGL